MSSLSQKRVLIVDDYQLVRQGLAFTLKEQNIDVVGEAENGEEALAMVAQLKPDVVLMDIGMPVMDGITATNRIKTDFPDTKVIMLTSHDAHEEVIAALSAGADAYCLKDIKTERLCQVMEVISDGALWLDPAIASVILQSLSTPENTKADDLHTPRRRYNTELTDREREVLQLIVSGKSNKEIAGELSVTIHTAKAHVASIIQKLSVDDRTQAAVKAVREGMISAS